VDPNKPLSDEDRAYLYARGYDDQVARMDAEADRQESGEVTVPTELVVDDDLPAYEDMSLADLQDECRARELPISGTKPQLIKRLEENDRLREQQS
jgi:hypothetical protein